MSRLSAFLHPTVTQLEEEVVISRRFLDEEGNPVPFKVRSLTQEENDALIKRSTHPVRDRNGQLQELLNNVEYTQRLIVAATVEPDFSAKELCDQCGVMNPLLVPGRMLFAGEYKALMDKIMEMSGFDDPAAVEAEAKN